MNRVLRFLGRCGAGRYCARAGLLLFLLPTAHAVDGLTEGLLEVSVNSATGGETVMVLRDAGNGIWLQAEDFTRFHLRKPSSKPVEEDGHQYYAVSEMPGAKITIDESTQHARVQLPPAAFEPTLLHGAEKPGAALSAVEPGAFLNYQISGEHTVGDRSVGALTELGIFGSPGVITNTVLGRSLDGSNEVIRLDTTLTHDFPDRLETLTLGDSISDAAPWSNSIRFAGLHWGTNFGIRPDLLTMPLLTAGGEAVVPSTVDVFVNGQRVSSQQVPSGPFVIDQVPSISGAGDLRIVVRDALGYERTIVQPFYSGNSLLAAGLSQYSIDMGPVRENYAVDSSSYGTGLASATYKRGLTDELTLEGHGEFQVNDAHAMGLDLAARTGSWGVASLTLGQGGAAGSSGWLTGAGFEHHGQRLNFLVNTLYATTGFREVGDSSALTSPLKERTIVQMGSTLSHGGSVAVAWVSERYQWSSSQQTATLSYNTQMGRSGWLGITATRTSGSQGATGIYATYTMTLGDRLTVSADGISNHGTSASGNELLTTLARSPPVGPGAGWRLGASTSGDYDASWEQRADAAEFDLEAARNEGISGQRGSLTGAVTWLDNDIRAARSVNGSFAVVDVADIPDVPVYLDNQLIARTDADGRALLPNLRAYEPNRISIEPLDLPLDTSIEENRIVLLPPYRSGVVARFPVKRIRGGTFRLTTPDGIALPPGASVKFNGGTFTVALDGVTYVDTFDHGAEGEANWGNTHCKFRLPPPPSDDPLPDMGTLVCKPDILTSATTAH